MKQCRFFLPILLVFVLVRPLQAQVKNLLTPEENLWLKSRNSTIVVYPEQNNPPYSYQNVSGNPQGLSIDYLELIAQKIGAKISYLTPRSHVQMLADIQNGKGDVVATLTPDSDREAYLLFTESYITVPAVIVVRKDIDSRMGLTLNDFNGKRVAVIASSALESYVHINYPRAVIEETTDDEVALQQVVLGEVDAAVMDVASLSYYLSKQVLSSVKIVGNTTFEYNPAFAVPKDKAILQGILEKGLSQVSTSDRAMLTEKWITVPGDQKNNNSFFIKIQNSLGFVTLAILFIAGTITIILVITRHRHSPLRYLRKKHAVDALKDEVAELEDASKSLIDELDSIKEMEKDIQSKIKEIE
jgi:ABC-type amino acid transport substrate-binding protein